MKKVLLAVCVVMMGSMFASAASTHYTVSLTTFCDIWNLTLDKGFNGITGLPTAGKVFVWGDHDLNTNCGLGVDLDTIGQKHGASAKVPPNDLFGTSQAVLDIQDTENAALSGSQEPVEFLLRVTNGCGAAAYIGGTGFGANIFIAEDTCTVGPAPSRKGLKPMIAR